MVEQKPINKHITSEQKGFVFQLIESKTIPKVFIRIITIKIKKLPAIRLKKKERHWISQIINQSDQYSYLKIEKISQKQGINVK